jgi:gamma-glutamylcyclotransferase (GGCT)/AIG2-like uncharacterized protein YtfP
VSRFLFAYGTLQFAPVLERLLGRVPTCVAVELLGYRRAAFVDASYPGAVADASARILGTCLGPLTPVEFQNLDEYEGERYERVPCWVNRQAGYVYVVQPPFRRLLSDVDWDAKRWQQASEIYLRELG